MAQPETTNAGDWERYMAITANNLAWGLSTKERSESEDSEMLNAAHTAAFHWKNVGTELNAARADMLLAEVHGLLGLGKTALKYATSVSQFFSGKEIPTWEKAFVSIVLSRAYKALGDTENYRIHLTSAHETIDQITDPGDREVVEASMPSLIA